MKPSLSLLAFFILAAAALPAAGRPQNAVVLDADGVANLRLEFATAEPVVFEETVFALGRIAPRPGAVAAVGGRIAGQVVGLSVQPGAVVAAEAELLRVESRQAGDPPPVVALRAPLAGTVTALHVHLGDPVEPGVALLEIADLSTVEAVAQVPESFVGRLEPGATARIRLPAFPGETFTGELDRLAPVADSATGTLAAHFRLPNPDGRLRPGLRAEFSLVVASRPEVLAVPRDAVQGEGADRFVFTRHFELPHAFVKTPVVVGAANDRFIEIVRGLFPGDEIVTRGAYSLAFAGGGGLSLKEALDAAHGHEHAADGSELPARAAPAPDPGHAHEHAGDHARPERPWQIATAALALATLSLLIAVARRRHA